MSVKFGFLWLYRTSHKLEKKVAHYVQLSEVAVCVTEIKEVYF